MHRSFAPRCCPASVVRAIPSEVEMQRQRCSLCVAVAALLPQSLLGHGMSSACFKPALWLRGRLMGKMERGCEQTEEHICLQKRYLSKPQHREADASYPTEIDGVPVQFEPGREDVAYSHHNRLRVSCNNPAHSKPCRKSRSMALQSDKLGPNAAHIFLGCWLAASDLPEIQHRAYRANMDCQLAYKAQRGL